MISCKTPARLHALCHRKQFFELHCWELWKKQNNKTKLLNVDLDGNAIKIQKCFHVQVILMNFHEKAALCVCRPFDNISMRKPLNSASWKFMKYFHDNLQAKCSFLFLFASQWNNLESGSGCWCDGRFLMFTIPEHTSSWLSVVVFVKIYAFRFTISIGFMMLDDKTFFRSFALAVNSSPWNLWFHFH